MNPPLTFWERLWILGAILAVLVIIGLLKSTFDGDGDGRARTVTVERTG